MWWVKPARSQKRPAPLPAPVPSRVGQNDLPGQAG